LVKIINDTFNINEIIDSNSTEVLLESEFTITDDMPDIERIVNIEGKTNLNNVAVTKDNITVDGRLIYNIIYLSDNENSTIHSMTGEIPFREEIGIEGISEDMEAFTDIFIDYIDADRVTERSFLVKAVLILDTDIYMKRPVTYVSDLESDGSIQAKAKNISFSDTAAVLSEEVNINDAVELSKGSDEIEKILREELSSELRKLDFIVYPSGANFLFVKSPIENLFEKLMERGVLIRKFKDEYYRITVGTKEENEIFIEELKRLF
jgi:hypothetical protein